MSVLYFEFVSVRFTSMFLREFWSNIIVVHNMVHYSNPKGSLQETMIIMNIIMPELDSPLLFKASFHELLCD